MSKNKQDNGNEKGMRELLLASGYAEEAVNYFMTKPNMGSMKNPDHKTELTGPCGDTMRCYLKINGGRIQEAKYEVLGVSRRDFCGNGPCRSGQREGAE